jgi:hypothetical protein
MKLAIYAICAIAMIIGGVSCTTEGGRSGGGTKLTECIVYIFIWL